MGEPANLENFEVLEIEDIKLYVEKGILENYVQNNVLLINIEGYGRYQLYITEEIYPSPGPNEKE